MARKSARSLMPSPPTICAPISRSVLGSPSSLTLVFLHPRVVAGPGDARRPHRHVRDAERCGQGLAEGHAADHPLAGDHAPRDVDRLVARFPPAAFAPATLPWA